jgi:hypothetical protein
MARHRQRHVSGWPAYLIAPVAIVAVILVKTASSMFRLKTTEDLTQNDVVSCLEDFIGGRGGKWDWDDFCCIPITDPTLDAIRQEAALVRLPLDEIGKAELRALLARARSITYAMAGMGRKQTLASQQSNGASGPRARSIASGDHLPDSYYIVLAIAARDTT